MAHLQLQIIFAVGPDHINLRPLICKCEYVVDLLYEDAFHNQYTTAVNINVFMLEREENQSTWSKTFKALGERSTTRTRSLTWNTCIHQKMFQWWQAQRANRLPHPYFPGIINYSFFPLCVGSLLTQDPDLPIYIRVIPRACIKRCFFRFRPFLSFFT